MSQIRRAAVLALVVILATSALLLGRWQLQRLGLRRATNAQLRAALAMAPVDIGVAPVDTMLDGRRIVARGHFDTARQVLLRGRARNSVPGLHVVTLFRVAGTDAPIWVLRGFAAAPDASTPPDSIPAPTAGEVRISGTAYALPRTTNRGQPIGTGPAQTYRRLDRDELRAIEPASLGAYVIADGGTGGPARLPEVAPPVLDDGPHLSYAIQWFAIALAIAAFGVIVLRRGGRGLPRPRAAP